MDFLSSKKRINVVGLRGIIGDLGRFQKGLTLEEIGRASCRERV